MADAPTVTRKRVRRGTTELADAAKAKARNHNKYRRPFPYEEVAASHVIDLMYQQWIIGPYGGNNEGPCGAGRRPKANVVACAMALHDDKRSFRNETDAKEQYGVARGTPVVAKWQPLLAALERCAPDVFATYMRRAREAKPKGLNEKELAAMCERDHKQSVAETRAETLRLSWADAMQHGVDMAHGLRPKRPHEREAERAEKCDICARAYPKDNYLVDGAVMIPCNQCGDKKAHTLCFSHSCREGAGTLDAGFTCSICQGRR